MTKGWANDDKACIVSKEKPRQPHLQRGRQHRQLKVVKLLLHIFMHEDDVGGVVDLDVGIALEAK